jgi:hypothetical protein
MAQQAIEAQQRRASILSGQGSVGSKSALAGGEDLGNAAVSEGVL